MLNPFARKNIDIQDVDEDIGEVTDPLSLTGIDDDRTDNSTRKNMTSIMFDKEMKSTDSDDKYRNLLKIKSSRNMKPEPWTMLSMKSNEQKNLSLYLSCQT